MGTPWLAPPIAAALLFAVTATPSLAGEFLLFPKPAKTLSAETLPYSPALQTVVENGSFCLSGRFGTDFFFAGYGFGGGTDKSMLLGISAAATINMRPAAGGRFPVDNFYALLAIHLSGTLSEKLSWRLYPVHHVSAHLADGYHGDILRGEVRAVSAEMARGEIYYKPLGELAEFGAAFGYYYHVCAQEGLAYRGELSALLKPPSPYKIRLGGDGGLSPYALLRVENVTRGKGYFGAEAALGAVLLMGGRGFGISAVYFNRPHRGYYFEKYEKGIGAEYTFLF
jgi:hypothetical protein